MSHVASKDPLWWYGLWDTMDEEHMRVRLNETIPKFWIARR